LKRATSSGERPALAAVDQIKTNSPKRIRQNEIGGGAAHSSARIRRAALGSASPRAKG
jgi:hypothetical protein